MKHIIDIEALFVRELQSIINRTVERMSPQRSKIYRMSREEGLSNDEIAKRLDISKRTVENHLTAALAILRKVLYLFFLVGRMFPLSASGYEGSRSDCRSGSKAYRERTDCRSFGLWYRQGA